MGNVLIVSDAFDAIRPAILQFVADQQKDAKRHFKKLFRMQSATLVVVLMSGNWSWSQEAIEEIPVSIRYCRSGNNFYPVGTLIKRTNGTYRECFVDRPGARPYWGTESRPRSRVPRLT